MPSGASFSPLGLVCLAFVPPLLLSTFILKDNKACKAVCLDAENQEGEVNRSNQPDKQVTFPLTPTPAPFHDVTLNFSQMLCN